MSLSWAFMNLCCHECWFLVRNEQITQLKQNASFCRTSCTVVPFEDWERQYVPRRLAFARVILEFFASEPFSPLRPFADYLSAEQTQCLMLLFPQRRFPMEMLAESLQAYHMAVSQVSIPQVRYVVPSSAFCTAGGRLRFLRQARTLIENGFAFLGSSANATRKIEVSDNIDQIVITIDYDCAQPSLWHFEVTDPLLSIHPTFTLL